MSLKELSVRPIHAPRRCGDRLPGGTQETSMKAVLTDPRPYCGHVVQKTVRYTHKNLHSAVTARPRAPNSGWIPRPSSTAGPSALQGSGQTLEGSGHGTAARQADETELEERVR